MEISLCVEQILKFVSGGASIVITDKQLEQFVVGAPC
jgi:hypothetical protein